MLRKSLLCAAVLFAGCDTATHEEDAFRDGLPSKQVVEMRSPSRSNGQALTAFYGEGEQAEYYRATVAAAVTFNGGTVSVLNLIEDIVRHVPTSIEGDVAVWGPHTGALDAVTWKLTVTRTGANSYTWVLEGKGKNEADSAFVAFLSGSHTASVDANGERVRGGYGAGEFLIDWDKAQTLPGVTRDDVGTAEIRYARAHASAEASVEADFRQVRDEERPGSRVDAVYRFQQEAGAGGTLDFAIRKNIDTDPLRSALENLSIKSRWEATGAGRSDIKVSGGDLFGEATLSECWDSNFLSAYFTVSVNPALGYGAVSACGNFGTAVYSTL
ncbi:hypothetical protein [Comamonas sp. JC664]|uniref:hypothetical protein n=1 Tax=Comamonas sp. JC664 TaxID=2801917 RepID=UPI00174CD878|nr:hypothetical protein [Comamonas sp. JC664]MBL0697135.1 hypothetical protein [Comamonas sp. JC664]GHG82707.1 hypothetical protein GCM10012319_37030 [Comamonas sp. KCTC 72670]